MNECNFLITFQIVRPVSVFLVVDVQNDFISGTLNISQCSARQNGAEVSKKETRKHTHLRVLKSISIPRLISS
jgi:nicotinamidase-related amidase